MFGTFFIFPYIYIGNVIIPTDYIIFFRGVGQPPSPAEIHPEVLKRDASELQLGGLKTIVITRVATFQWKKSQTKSHCNRQSQTKSSSCGAKGLRQKVCSLQYIIPSRRE